MSSEGSEGLWGAPPGVTGANLVDFFSSEVLLDHNPPVLGGGILRFCSKIPKILCVSLKVVVSLKVAKRDVVENGWKVRCRVGTKY